MATLMAIFLGGEIIADENTSKGLNWFVRYKLWRGDVRINTSHFTTTNFYKDTQAQERIISVVVVKAL